ncbi:hypothetical protein AVE81_003874 [Salmonella enterica subsp. diarizonae]|nr:hypothetical protein [Salmonella enterica subsp. diarizonae]
MLAEFGYHNPGQQSLTGDPPLDGTRRGWRFHVNAKIFDRFGDADDFLDCFIMPAHIVGGTFRG